MVPGSKSEDYATDSNNVQKALWRENADNYLKKACANSVNNVTILCAIYKFNLFNMSWLETNKRTTRRALGESAHLRHAMPDPQEHIGPNTFLKYHAIYRFWPYLLMVKNHFEN